MNPKTKYHALMTGVLLGIAVMIALAMIQDAHAAMRPPSDLKHIEPPTLWTRALPVLKAWRFFVPFLP